MPYDLPLLHPSFSGNAEAITWSLSLLPCDGDDTHGLSSNNYAFIDNFKLSSNTTPQFEGGCNILHILDGPGEGGQKVKEIGVFSHTYVREPLCVLPQHHCSTWQQHTLRLHLHPHLHISKQESHCTCSSTTWMVIGRFNTQSCCCFIHPQSCHFIRRQRGRHGVGGIRRVGCRHDEEGRLTKMNTLLYYYLSLKSILHTLHYIAVSHCLR